MHPDNPKVLCNRAMAYKKLGKFQLMYDDSLLAIELDPSNYKAYIKNGEACLELGKHKNQKSTEMCEKGLNRLKKAIMIIEKLKSTDPLYKSKKILIGQVEKLIL